MNSIAKELNRSREKIRKIVIKRFPKYFSLIWKADYKLSAKQKKLLYEWLDIEVEKDNPTSLSEIGRNLGLSYDTIRYHAKKQYPNSFNDIWGIPQLNADEIKTIQDRYQQEIKKNEKYNENNIVYDEFSQKFEFTKNEVYKPDSVSRIANDLNRSYDTITRSFKRIDPEKYNLIYAKTRLTNEKLDSIISDILCTKTPQTGLGEMHNVSPGTISKISLERVQPNYDDYDHNKRFPHDVYQQLGFATHQIVQCISTNHLREFSIYKFSEITEGNYRIDDLLPLAELYKFYDVFIKLNKERLSLWNVLGLSDCNEIVFEYTNYISQKQCQTKARKYFKPKRKLLIVGTRWYDKKYPNPIIHTRFKNVKIIKHDIFTKLIGLSGKLLKEFEKAIQLNYNYDLDGMNTFKDEITLKYPKLGFSEYKNYCKKILYNKPY